MIFRSKQKFKGFFLQEEFIFDSEIAVLTGRNGAGKTRFLEAVNGAIEVSGDEGIIPHGKIKFISVSTMQGVLRNGYSKLDVQAKLSELGAVLDSSRDYFASPQNVNDYDEPIGGDGSYGRREAHQIFSRVAQKLGKSVRELSSEEFKFYYEDPATAWDVLDIGALCNEYLRKQNRNSYSSWLAQVHGKRVTYLEPNDFEIFFGEPPWILYNQVLQEVFDNKISMRFPIDEHSEEIYVPALVEDSTGEPLSPEMLSSGEKNLLWLASIFFNLRFGVGSPEGMPELILMDEPDAFLHPKMVVKFYSVIQLISRQFNCKIIFTTHSPTTVALAPNDNCVYRVTPNSITRVEKDDAISDLLEGVTQISLSPHNRREVFVEHRSDANAYRYIFDKIKSKFTKVDPKISLTFLAAGAKMSAGQIEQNINQFLPGITEDNRRLFIEGVNGIGDCGQVIGMVDSLTKAGNTTVRGLIDWDLKNKPVKNVVVSGLQLFYTIENIVLNPIYLIRILYGHSSGRYELSKYCGQDVSLNDWKEDLVLLQLSIDVFLEDFFGRPNNKDSMIEFLGGHVMYLDSEYLLTNGHDLMKRILGTYRELNESARKEGDLVFKLVKVMVDDFGWKHVPCCFDDAFSSLQR